MDYRELLDAVRRHVKQLKVDCAVTSGKPASEKAVAAAEAKLNVCLPAELRESYRTVADGYAMFWQADANDSEQPFGGLRVPSLFSLAETYSGWRGMADYRQAIADAGEIIDEVIASEQDEEEKRPLVAMKPALFGNVDLAWSQW